MLQPTESAGFLGAAIGRFHDARAAAGHHGESGPGQARTNLAGQLVVGLILRESGRPEYRHARADEMQGSESVEEFPEDARGSSQLDAARLRPMKESRHLRC